MSSARRITPSADHSSVPWLLRSGYHLFGAYFVILFTVVGAFYYVLQEQAKQFLRHQVEQQLQSNTVMAARLVQEHLLGLIRYAELFSHRGSFLLALKTGEKARISGYLEEFLNINPQFNRVFVADPKGIELYDFPHDPSVIGGDFSHRDWYKGVIKANEPYVSEVYLRAAIPQVYLIAVAAPLRDAQGDLLGFLVAQYTIEDLSQWLSKISQMQKGDLLVIDHHGILASRMSTANGLLQHLDEYPYMQRILAGSPQIRTATDIPGGEEALFFPAAVMPFQWWVVGRYPLAALYEILLPLRWTLLWTSGGFFLFTLALGFYLINHIRKNHLEHVKLSAAKVLLTDMIVHDMRNPLTGIGGWLEVLGYLVEEGDQEKRKALQNLQLSVTQLQEMLQNILDVIRMEDRKMPVRLEDCDLQRILQEECLQYLGIAQAHDLTFQTTGLDRSLKMRVDANLIRRVFQNLIANAIKHTPRGGTIEVGLDRSEADNRVRIKVKDSGQGIPKELQGSLFQKYGRLEYEGKIQTRYDTGLGLVFCRMAVELHGGGISVESDLGKGSEFIVSLPAG